MSLTEFAKFNNVPLTTLKRIEADEDGKYTDALYKISIHNHIDLSDYGIPNLQTTNKPGERIRIYKIKKGLTTNELAARSHISRETMRNIELCKIIPSQDSIRLIADALQVEPYALDKTFNLKEWTILDYVTYYRKKRNINVKNLLKKTGFHPSKLHLLNQQGALLTRSDFQTLSKVLDSSEFDRVIKNFLESEIIDLTYYRKSTGISNEELITRYHFKSRELREYDCGEKEPSLYYISVVCELNHISIKTFVSNITLTQLVKYYRDKNNILKKDLAQLLGTYKKAVTDVESGEEIGIKKYNSFYQKMKILIQEDYEKNPDDPVYKMWYAQEKIRLGE